MVRNAYGRRIRDLVKKNAQKRVEAGNNAASISPATSEHKKQQHVSDRANENIVDIGVREDAARRKAITHAIDSRCQRHDTVDWSFFDATDIESLRQQAPRQGEVFKINQKHLQKLSSERAEEAKKAKLVADHERLREIYTFGEQVKQSVLKNPESQSNQMTYIKAKDRTYAFVDKVNSLTDSTSKGGGVSGKWMVRNAQGILEERILSGDALQEYEEKLGLYRCTYLRLNNNKLTSIASLATDVRNLLFRPATYLSIIDLSGNLIRSLPKEGFDGLPLHTILLHGNLIDDIQELYKLEHLGEHLRKLTLYGNPVQRKVHPDLRSITLNILPFLNVFDDTPVSTRERMEQQSRAPPPTLLKTQQSREKALKAASKAEAALAALSYYSGRSSSPLPGGQSRAPSPTGNSLNLTMSQQRGSSPNSSPLRGGQSNSPTALLPPIKR